MTAFTIDDAKALRQRLECGWSTLDPETGNERAVPITRSRRGRDLRRPPSEFANVPTVAQLLAMFAVPKVDVAPTIAEENAC